MPPRTPAPYPWPHIGLNIPIVTPAGDAVLSVFRSLPGSDWVETAIKNGATWIGDFAKTKVGFFALQVISNQLYLPLANAGIYLNTGNQLVVGPQLASVVFAIPGVVAGEDFVKAYTSELADRIVALIEFFAGKEAGDAGRELGASVSNEFTSQIQHLEQDPNLRLAVDKLKGDLTERGVQVTKERLAAAGLSPEQIAQKFGTRADAAAAALNAYFQAHIYRVGSPAPFNGVVTADYDYNGNPIPPSTPPFPANFSSAVTHAQQNLKTLGFLQGHPTPGVIDNDTRAALRAAQLSYGLSPTGDLDVRTEAAILQAVQDLAHPVPVPFPLPDPLPIVLSNALSVASRYAPEAVPVLQTEIAKLSRGEPLSVPALQFAADRLRTSPAGQPAAQQIAMSLARPLPIAGKNPVRVTVTPNNMISQLFTFAFLTSPLWGTMLLFRSRQP